MRAQHPAFSFASDDEMGDHDSNSSSAISRRAALRACLGSGIVLSGCARPMNAELSPDAIEVIAAASTTDGRLRFGALNVPCMLGRSGIVAEKREGDGGTPSGTFPLREVRYRPDRVAAPITKGLAVRASRESDGWCDAPNDPAYNRIVRLPYPASAEKMWRDDGLYDVLAVIGYNDDPPVAGLGSAIFLHVAREDAVMAKLLPTVGCVAMKIGDLRAVLASCTATTRVQIRTR